MGIDRDQYIAQVAHDLRMSIEEVEVGEKVRRARDTLDEAAEMAREAGLLGEVADMLAGLADHIDRVSLLLDILMGEEGLARPRS